MSDFCGAAEAAHSPDFVCFYQVVSKLSEIGHHQRQNDMFMVRLVKWLIFWVSINRNKLFCQQVIQYKQRLMNICKPDNEYSAFAGRLFTT